MAPDKQVCISGHFINENYEKLFVDDLHTSAIKSQIRALLLCIHYLVHITKKCLSISLNHIAERIPFIIVILIFINYNILDHCMNCKDLNHPV